MCISCSIFCEIGISDGKDSVAFIIPLDCKLLGDYCFTFFLESDGASTLTPPTIVNTVQF